MPQAPEAAAVERKSRAGVAVLDLDPFAAEFLADPYPFHHVLPEIRAVVHLYPDRRCANVVPRSHVGLCPGLFRRCPERDAPAGVDPHLLEQHGRTSTGPGRGSLP